MPRRAVLAIAALAVVAVVGVVLVGFMMLGGQTGTVTSYGDASCSTGSPAIAVHFTTQPGTEVVYVGIYYDGTVISVPGGHNTITLSDPSVLDWTAQLPFDTALDVCSGNFDPMIAASRDSDGVQIVSSPTTYLVKIFRPTDMAVLAAGNITVKP